MSEGAGQRLTDEQRIDWLRLIRTENVGPRGILAQMPQGSAYEVWPLAGAASWRRYVRRTSLSL